MRRLVLIASLTLAACGIRNPVRTTLTIEPHEDRSHVTVTARTEILDSAGDAVERARIDEIRNALAERRDVWTPRFASVNPVTEHIAFDKSGGELRRAEHSGTFAVDDLQRFISEMGTMQITDGEKWSELAFYPTTSTRASRQQREHVEEAMRMWSRDAVRYFRALGALYRYLDREPTRARAVFTLLFSDKEDEHSTIEEEDALITAVSKSMTAIIDHVDAAKKNGMRLDEEFDLVFNPLPGDIVVRTPATILGFEGFERRDDRTVAIPRSGLIDAVLSFENKWVSPDPLAIAGHADEKHEEMPSAEEMASRPRSWSSSVTVEEVETALAARLKPGSTAYRVRWTN